MSGWPNCVGSQARLTVGWFPHAESCGPDCSFPFPKTAVRIPARKEEILPRVIGCGFSVGSSVDGKRRCEPPNPCSVEPANSAVLPTAKSNNPLAEPGVVFGSFLPVLTDFPLSIHTSGLVSGTTTSTDFLLRISSRRNPFCSQRVCHTRASASS